MIKELKIENFRSIKSQKIELKNYTIFIGDNGTGKTSVLEAINYALSPSFLSGRIKHTDFYNGEEIPISIELIFDNNLKAKLPDGYEKQEINYDKLLLKIKFREKKSPEKAFSDLVVIDHRIEPSNLIKRTDKGWSIPRKKSKNEFEFTERLLALNIIETQDLPKSFYFSKSRDKQLQGGFSSSINKVFDDFNWRFLKNDNSKNFFREKSKIEKEILDLIDVKENVFDQLNKKLSKFNIPNIDISFIDGKAPFNNAYLTKKENLDLPVKYLGSGVEMIISLLFLETIASFSKEKLVILIDEPELHLHPSLQYKLADHLEDISKTHQVIVSTHSPIFFKNSLKKDKKDNIQLLVAKNENGESKFSNSEVFGLFPWSPSWGEINYFAFNYPTIEFHDELYGYLQEITEKYKQDEFENWLMEQGISKNKTWTKETKGNPQQPKEVTLPTFIRNKVHHPENETMQDTNFTEDELKDSIRIMIGLIKKLRPIKKKD